MSSDWFANCEMAHEMFDSPPGVNRILINQLWQNLASGHEMSISKFQKGLPRLIQTTGPVFCSEKRSGNRQRGQVKRCKSKGGWSQKVGGTF